MTDAAASDGVRIGVAGAPGPRLAALLADARGVTPVPIADPAHPPAGLALAIVGARTVTAQADAQADVALLAALLAALPAGTPVAALLAASTLHDLVPLPRRAGRLVGLELHPAADGGAATPTELAIPADADPVRADAVLAVLAAAGCDPVPVGDTHGRVVRQLGALLADAADAARDAADPERRTLLAVNAAYALADAGAGGTAEIDRLAVRAGLVTEAPFAAAGRIGLRAVVAGLDARARAAQAAGDAAELARCRPALLLWRIATV